MEYKKKKKKKKYCELRRMSRLFEPEKKSPKQGVDLNGRDKMQTFTTKWQTSGAALTITVCYI